ncbi:MAG: recombinase family protein [Microthrixaceae bacterium]|nr:recombinase family protein [Microthrixaceae bacterium]
MKAVGYVRVSHEEQVREGVSLGAQRAAIAAYCAMKSLDLVEVVEDAGVSGGKPLGHRGGGARLIEVAGRRGIKAVVAVKLDRLFRNAADALRQTEAWDRAGIALHLIDLGGSSIDTGTAMGRFFLTVMAGAAEMERGLVAERTVAALAHKRAIGEKTGGDPPYGFSVGDDGRKLVPVEPEQAVIQRVRTMRQQGYSFREIADRFNRESVQARGEKWHETTLKRLMDRGG